MKLRWLGGLLAVALTACSTTTSGQAIAPSSLDLARVVLQQNDFPAGWQARPAQTSTEDSDVQAKVAACVGVKFDDSRRVARAISPDFHSGTLTASSIAASYKSPAEVRNRLAVLRNPKAADCFTTALRDQLVAQLPANTTVVDVTVHVDQGGAAANVAATAHAVITVSALGQTARVYSDTAFITGVQFGAQVAFTGIGVPVPTGVQTRVTVQVARRAAKV